MQIGRWTAETEDFVKKFQKRVGEQEGCRFLFSFMKTVSEREGKTADLEKARKIDLDDKIVKYNLHPLAVGFFGGVLDFNKMNINNSAKPLVLLGLNWIKMALTN